MFTLKYELEILFIILVASVVTTFFLFQKNHQFQAQAITPLPHFVSSTLTPTPTVAPVPTTTTSSWISPDGSSTITLTVTNNQNATKTYAFSVSSSSNNSNSIFSKTVGNGSVFSIPFNAFSPDDNYVFIQDKELDMTHYLVFNASGKPFANGQQYLDISSLFQNYTSSYSLYQVTGWASDTLLVVETNNDSGTTFWFDLTNNSFTPLATRF